jgi:hypothetical protein
MGIRRVAGTTCITWEKGGAGRAFVVYPYIVFFGWGTSKRVVIQDVPVHGFRPVLVVTEDLG